VRESPRATAPPYIRDGLDSKAMMHAVLVALAPAGVGAVYFFGSRVLLVICLASLSAVVTEAACQLAIRRKMTVSDGSAVVTGVLLAFTLPPTVPYWLPVVGSIFAVAVVKVAFGGLGSNLVNPALAARAFLMLAWPAHLMVWAAPARGTLSGISGMDAVTTATPLGVYGMARGILSDPSAPAQEIAVAANNLKYLGSSDSLKNLLFGNVGGSIGETSVLLLAIGGLYLLARRIICWEIPAAFVLTVGFLTWALGGQGAFTGSPLFHAMSGGLMLGALFMATDPVTSPVTPVGRLIFGFGCGVITSIIRLTGGYPEGVCYSILLMNLTVPLLDRATRPRIFGEPGRVC
jgi:electron transport complex protein RnfD